MWIWKLIEAITLATGLVYFIDIQSDGDIDLPHRVMKIDENSKLYKFFMKIAEIIEKAN